MSDDDNAPIDRDQQTELETILDTALPIEQFEKEFEGATIGRYKLIEKIGEGGFGSVWMAEQQEPIVRKVALKIIKLGMDTKEVIARFEAERQALALMDHPHIAKVLDAGATDSGRPFFVMELVDGIPITKFADEHKLNTQARLDLFNDVCTAIQHAHQKGIIHRDIKPSNILVTATDDHPVPKVIDFGIAKATEERLTDSTLMTRAEQIIGTPAYMSPEQASRTGVDIDTRSDIYSLGVLLYELLTGKPPFDSRTLMEAGYEEIRRIIREETPPKPSTRIETLAGEETKATQHTPLDKLGRILRGDLDWIVMKAIEKDRARRYDTADAFAEDIGRYLRSEPVSAAAPSVSYRLSRYLRRNRTAVTIGSLFALLLVVGTVVSVKQMFRALAAETRAKEIAADEAREADTARRAVLMTRTIFESADPIRVRDPNYTVNELLDDFTASVDWKELAEEPQIEISMRTTIAQAYLNLGRFPEAITHGEREVELGNLIWGDENAELADSMERLAYAYRVQNEGEKGEQQYRDSLAMREKLFGDEHPDVAASMAGLAAILTDQNKLEEAGPLHTRALEMRKKLLGDEHEDVIDSLTEYAAFLRMSKRFSEAEEVERQALTRTETETESTTALRAKGLLIFSLAQTLERQGRLGEAEAKYREAAAMAKEHLGAKNPFRGPPMLGLGRVLQAQNRLPEAETVLRETLTLGESVPGEKEHILVTMTRASLAALLFQTGQTAEAETLFLKSVEAIRKIEGDEYPGIDDLIHGTAEILRRQGKLEEAGELHREALALRKKLYGDKTLKTAISLNNVGLVLDGQNIPAEAETYYRESVAVLTQLKSVDLVNANVVTSNLIYNLRSQGKEAEIAQVETARAQIVENHNLAALELAGPVSKVIVSPDSQWRWLHPTDGVDPGAKIPDFHQTFFLQDFDDSNWNLGSDSRGPKGGFSYGELDSEGVDLGQPNPGNRHCAYLRLKFTTEEELSNLELRLRRDDGAIVYLDGKEVIRDNVSPGEEAYKLAAINPVSFLDENLVHRHPIAGPLPPGEHTLAISVHNRGDGSSDLRVAEITLVALD